MSLDLDNFADRVLSVQARAIARDCERTIAQTMQAETANATLAAAYDATNPALTFSAARKVLRDNGVSADVPLLAAVGSQVWSDLQDAPLTVRTFDADGKVRGFTVQESTRLAPEEAIFYIKSAFVLAVRAPEVPMGVAHGASVMTQGFAVLNTVDYDSTVLADRSNVSTFIGAKAMPLAVDGEDGTVTLVEGGAAVRVLTAA